MFGKKNKNIIVITINNICIINPNGTIDTTFSVSVTGISGSITSIAVDETNQSIYCNNGITGYISKLNYDGSFDTTFNTNIVNGYAGLDSSGKIFTSQIPISGLQYIGVWNANTNTPVITSSVGSAGNYYKVSVDGNTNIDGILTGDNQTMWVTYRFNSTAFTDSLHCNYYTQISGPTTGCTTGSQNVSIRFGEEFCFLSQPCSGYSANEFVVLAQITTGGTLPSPTN